MNLLSPARPAAPRFGESYYNMRVGGAYAALPGEGKLVRAVNSIDDHGSYIPLMTELRPSQAALLQGVNDRLDTLNANITEGFDKVAQALASRGL